MSCSAKFSAVFIDKKCIKETHLGKVSAKKTRTLCEVSFLYLLQICLPTLLINIEAIEQFSSTNDF